MKRTTDAVTAGETITKSSGTVDQQYQTRPQPSGADMGLLPIVSLVQDFLEYLGDYRQSSPLTIQAYERDLTRLHKFLISHRLPTSPEELTSRHLQAFAISLSGLAPATIRRALNAVSSFCAYLIRCGVRADNPVTGVEKPRRPSRPPRVPSQDECRRLVAAAKGTRERAMMMLLVTAGLRRAEVLDLRTANLAADLSKVTVVGKGDKTRIIPLPHQTQTVLAEYLAERDAASTFLFPNTVGRRMSNTTFYRFFRRILRRAALDEVDITPHTLRHFYATTLLHSAVDIKTVQTLLGHADLSTTSRYLHTNADAQRRAAEALPNFLPHSDREGE